ncbi:MAG: four helix bundle protein [Bacteroidota bacterium]
MKEKDIKILDRSYRFALRILKMARQLPTKPDVRIISNQLLRSVTSIGANVEEAIGAYSKPEFTHRMSIALREARESHYWLRLMRDLEIVKASRFSSVINEAEEIKKILGAIVRTSRTKKV